MDIPEKARADSYHLAIAARHGIDFLVSWNCTHIVNGRIKMMIEEINARQGIRTPIICTPESKYNKKNNTEEIYCSRL